MLVSGMVLGFMTLGGCYVMYKRLPSGLKQFCQRHPLLVDLLLAGAFYSIMGPTLVAHVAAATMSLGAMGLLHMARHPQDFEFVTDSIEAAKQQFSNALDKLRQINEEHKRRKLASVG